jgi:hypothetical protein
MNMKFFKITLLLFLFPMLVSSVSHKFYVSMTNLEYVPEKQTIQIISKIFIEDLEQVLQKRYSPLVVLNPKKETEADINYLKKYVSQKLKISINNKPVELIYIGKEYDIDMVNMYFEIENISELTSIEIKNKILFDMFPEQQNIIHIISPDTNRKMILDKDHPDGLLNFN